MAEQFPEQHYSNLFGGVVASGGTLVALTPSLDYDFVVTLFTITTSTAGASNVYINNNKHGEHLFTYVSITAFATVIPPIAGQVWAPGDGFTLISGAGALNYSVSGRFVPRGYA